MENAGTRTLARGVETNFLSLQTNTRKRQNHAFAFFTYQRGAARRKGEGGAHKKRRAPKGAPPRKTPAAPRQSADSGVSLKITENRRQQPAEERVNLISQKRKNDAFSFFPL